MSQSPSQSDGSCVVPEGKDPMKCNPVSSIESRWRCNIPGITAGDWPGSVIAWPSWAAYECNNRAGDQSRTVYSLDGQMLYPYMGPWANGGQVAVISGDVLIVEWKRGGKIWRETRLKPGDTYTIALRDDEDNALIESPDGAEPRFTVSLAHFKPERIR